MGFRGVFYNMYAMQSISSPDSLNFWHYNFVRIIYANETKCCSLFGKHVGIGVMAKMSKGTCYIKMLDVQWIYLRDPFEFIRKSTNHHHIISIKHLTKSPIQTSVVNIQNVLGSKPYNICVQDLLHCCTVVIPCSIFSILSIAIWKS